MSWICTFHLRTDELISTVHELISYVQMSGSAACRWVYQLRTDEIISSVQMSWSAACKCWSGPYRWVINTAVLLRADELISSMQISWSAQMSWSAAYKWVDQICIDEFWFSAPYRWVDQLRPAELISFLKMSWPAHYRWVDQHRANELSTLPDSGGNTVIIIGDNFFDGLQVSS